MGLGAAQCHCRDRGQPVCDGVDLVPTRYAVVLGQSTSGPATDVEHDGAWWHHHDVSGAVAADPLAEGVLVVPVPVTWTGTAHPVNGAGQIGYAVAPGVVEHGTDASLGAGVEWFFCHAVDPSTCVSTDPPHA